MIPSNEKKLTTIFPPHPMFVSLVHYCACSPSLLFLMLAAHAKLSISTWQTPSQRAKPHLACQPPSPFSFYNVTRRKHADFVRNPNICELLPGNTATLSSTATFVLKFQPQPKIAAWPSGTHWPSIGRSKDAATRAKRFQNTKFFSASADWPSREPI